MIEISFNSDIFMFKTCITFDVKPKALKSMKT